MFVHNGLIMIYSYLPKKINRYILNPLRRLERAYCDPDLWNEVIISKASVRTKNNQFYYEVFSKFTQVW